MRKFDAYSKSDPGNNGLNNASILTFSKDVVDALIKELTQNSIDAKLDPSGKVRVKIGMLEMDPNDIQGIDSLRVILRNMSDYWGNLNQADFVKFFNKANDLIDEEKLQLFSFEDFNTKGLEGDETYGSLKNLIYDEGVSDSKPNNALGGFGIGKNSFFALTSLQTVFYSSYNKEIGHSFIGVTKLAEYINENNERKNNRVYYGDWENGKVRCISDESSIPEAFRRTEYGLSSFALGVTPDPDWKNLVIKALIKNYWFLFERDLIEAEVDGEKIDHSNYFEYATEIFEDDTSILAFIETYRKPDRTFPYTIHEVGGIKVLLSEQPEESEIHYPDKVVFIRDGMMIKEYNLGVRNLPNRVAGIIYCETPEGNKILSKMEPPAHNDFESFYLPKKHPTLTEKDGKRIIREIESSKTKSVREIKNLYNQPTKQVGFIDELLAGLSVSNGEGDSVGKSSICKEETFDVAKKEGEMELKISSNKPNVVYGGEDKELELEAGGKKVESREGEGGGDETDGGGDGDGSGGTGTKKKRKRKKENISSAKFYFSHTESGLNHYLLIVYADSVMNNVSLKFTQHGDSPAKAVSTELMEVSNESGKFNFLKHSSFYEIRGLALKPKLKNMFEVVFKETFQSAFKILN